MTGDELQTIRRQLGWTQEALALRLGVTRNAVNQWEHGRRPISRTIEILLGYLVADKRQKKEDRR